MITTANDKYKGSAKMRNINKIPPKIYFFFTVVCSVYAMIIYRSTIFRCLFLSTYNESKVVLWIIWAVSLTVTYLLTYKRRRNYLSLFTSTVLPFEIYTLMTYDEHYYLIGAVELIAIILSGAYCLLVMLRKVKPDSINGIIKVYKRRIFNCINGAKSISAVCFSALLVYAFALYAFNAPSVIPAVKPIAEVNENKYEMLSDNMPEISVIDDSVWNTLSFDEKVDALQTLANVEKVQLGICHEINVCVEALGSSTYGSYDYSTHRVRINEQIIEDETAYQCVETLCHELRHAYQHDVVDAYLSLDKEHQQLEIFNDVRRYYESLDDYQYASIDGFDAYESQLVEVDSRKYGEERAAFYFAQVEKYLDDVV